MVQLQVEDTLSDYPKSSRKKWFVVTDKKRELVLYALHPIELWIPYNDDWAVHMPMTFSCVPRAQRIANRVHGRVRSVPYEAFQPRLFP